MNDTETYYSIKVKDWYVTGFDIKSDGLTSLDIKVKVTSELQKAWRYSIIEDAEYLAKLLQGKVVQW